MCSCECLDCGKTNLIERESQITEGMRMFGNMELEVITILILYLAMRTNLFAEIDRVALEDRKCYGRITKES